MKKRSNPYDVEDVIKRHNISEEEAIKKIQELKRKTSGNLETYIKKHGKELGLQKYKEFCNKSAITLDRYIKKYGESLGRVKYEEYCKSKSFTLEKCIKKHGENGKIVWQERQKKWQNTLKSKSPEEIDRINKLKSNTIHNFIRKYGTDLGTKKYEEVNNKKGFTFEKCIEKYGEKEGLIKYKNKLRDCSPTFVELCKLYTKDNAIEIYESYDSGTKLNKDYGLKVGIKTTFNKLNKSYPASKISNKFFKELEKQIDRELQYGSKKREIKIFEKMNHILYHYDCYDEKTNTIIEYQGRAWHPKEGDINWVHPFGEDYDTVFKRDQNKKSAAVENGYNFIEVFEIDIHYKHEFNKKIQEIKGLLSNENKKNQE